MENVNVEKTHGAERPAEPAEPPVQPASAGREKRAAVRNIIFEIITAAAVAVLVANLLFPVLRIYGTSMEPTLSEGNIVVTLKWSKFKQGDLIAFYYNNKVLVKRVIACPGSMVDIDRNGNVFVDGYPINEPYVHEKALGECNIELPYQVPEGRYFVMGDHRLTSIDSRNTQIGCVEEEYIVGRLLFCIWPLKAVGAKNF